MFFCGDSTSLSSNCCTLNVDLLIHLSHHFSMFLPMCKTPLHCLIFSCCAYAYALIIIVTSTQATVIHIQPSSLFTFNCAPLAMPGEFVFRKDDTIIIRTYTLDHYTINGPLLSIMPVVRSDSGRYSCTANNTAGIISVVSFTLNVVGGCMCVQVAHTVFTTC